MSDLRKTSTVSSFTEDEALPQLGEWYWVKIKDHYNGYSKPETTREQFLCVTHVGSNYVEVSAPREKYSSSSHRIHIDEWKARARRAEDPEGYIAGRTEEYQTEIRQLMGRVKELTAGLAVNLEPKLLHEGEVTETQALSLRGQGNSDMRGYKQALVKAKTEQLPALFKQIEVASEQLSRWMKASSLPLRAKAESMKESLSAIDDRIFNVELYAGLIDEIVQISDGAPAPQHEKVRLLQRRHYMDEECLAQYRTGGMEFKDIGEFDQWLAEPENRDRILPFPRAVVAFRVRRYDKEREVVNIGDYFRIVKLKEADKFTFLYMRNGEQLYRLSTEIEFDERLFPDLSQVELEGKLWAKCKYDKVDTIITDAQYQGIVEEYAREKAEYDRIKAMPKAQRTKEEDWHVTFGFRPDEDPRDYMPFDPSTVYFDDIAEKVTADMQRHNRIALLMQGLFDRSTVFHPHPGWQLWEAQGFTDALELVYDDTRALTPGEKPDFEAYRARLNKSLTAGSVTVGQDDVWQEREAKVYCDKNPHSNYCPERYKPYGDPGPGVLARVVKKTGKTCTFRWRKERAYSWRSRWDDPKDPFVTKSLIAPVDRLLNVDAYTPGDFKQFFADPRTRAEYLKWAPLLLEAEEYHAGNRKVEE